MRLICKFLILATFVAVVPYYAQSNKQQRRQTKLHSTTDWRIQPSFTFDTICLLNVLTGDPYYVNYYKDDYARFEPKLTPDVRVALANLKRKIKQRAPA